MQRSQVFCSLPRNGKKTFSYNTTVNHIGSMVSPLYVIVYWCYLQPFLHCWNNESV
jgi:hypothetical protein